MRFDESARLFERARRVIPGGINSNVRAMWDPHPMFYARGEGARVWDADGNEFIDYVLGRGPALLGHSPRPVIEAVAEQLYKGLIYSGQTEVEIEAAELVCQFTPCAERVRFTSSGSESVHAALRLARAVTGRRKILRFESGYHGWFDNIAWSNGCPLDKAGPRERPNVIPSSEGMNPDDAKNLIVIPWNDPALVEQVFAEHGGEIAAIITEPLMANNGAVAPKEGFLAGLRAVCDKHGSLLIFDEVITGFRLALSSGQGYYGVTPDLATFAKAIAGGMPVGAFAGKAEYMDRIGALKTVHAGTYNAMPMMMAAVKAALNMLSADDAMLLNQAHGVAERLREGFREIGRKLELPLAVRGAGPIMHVSFLPPDAAPVVDSRTYAQTDTARTRRLFREFQERGIRSTPAGLMFVSTAHGDREVEQTLEAAGDAMAAMAKTW
ncbi:MAG: aspartate aminotransferase family protein [Candidatus Sumerlaeia bacterium]